MSLYSLFATAYGYYITALYVENESKVKLTHPKLMQLINDTHKCDMIFFG